MIFHFGVSENKNAMIQRDRKGKGNTVVYNLMFFGDQTQTVK